MKKPPRYYVVLGLRRLLEEDESGVVAFLPVFRNKKKAEDWARDRYTISTVEEVSNEGRPSTAVRVA